MRNIVFLFILILFSAPAYSYDSEGELLHIDTNTEKGRVDFYIEIADTPEKRSKGLMFRKNLEDHKGMLFRLDKERKITMWMKNTLIPLDIVFINKDNKIVKIVKETTPNSLKAISSDVPVTAVLEINGGICDLMGVAKNNVVSYNMF